MKTCIIVQTYIYDIFILLYQCLNGMMPWALNGHCNASIHLLNTTHVVLKFLKVYPVRYIKIVVQSAHDSLSVETLVHVICTYKSGCPVYLSWEYGMRLNI